MKKKNFINIKRTKKCYLVTNNNKRVINSVIEYPLEYKNKKLLNTIIKKIKKHDVITLEKNYIILNLLEKKIFNIIKKNFNTMILDHNAYFSINKAIQLSFYQRIIKKEYKKNTVLSLDYNNNNYTIILKEFNNKSFIISNKNYFDSIKNVVYVNDINSVVWENCDVLWKKIEKNLNLIKDIVSVIIFEPIINTKNFKIYSKDFLNKLITWAKINDIHTIANESMIDIGRTGKMFAIEHLNQNVDFLCLSRGLTSGWYPMSILLTNNYNFPLSKKYSENNIHASNIMGTLITLECLKIINSFNIYEKCNNIAKLLKKLMHEIKDKTDKINNIRNIGFMVAADLNSNNIKKINNFIDITKQYGVFINIKKNSIYWSMPLQTEKKIFIKLKNIIIKSLEESF